MPDTSQKSVTPNVDTLAKAAQAESKGKGLPPVHLWNPPFCGDLDMRIARDGTWFYLGTPIGRKRMVRLFSTILKKEDEKYFLVTPVEKMGIIVEDAPFVAVDFSVDGIGPDQEIRFTTNVGDTSVAGQDNPIRLTFDESGEPSPYIHIRAGMEALIDRKSFYRLVEMGEAHEIDGQEWFGVWSQGKFFPFMTIAEIYRKVGDA